MKAALSAEDRPAGPRAGAVPSARGDNAAVNNAWYDALGDGWHDAWDHPVALLRAEGALKAPWVAARLREAGFARAGVLDLGCGGGFLARALRDAGHRPIGLDASPGSLAAARRADGDEKVPGARPGYVAADAYRLPFAGAGFDAVCAMDFLEHVTDPARVVAEAARVLRPGGLFFFHTFNRNPLAWAFAVKGVEWFVRNAPPRMHALSLFIKPAELEAMCARAGLRVEGMSGIRPGFGAAFWRLLATRRVPRDFRFRLTPSLAISYLGYAVKASG